MSCLSGYLDMNVAAAVRNSYYMVRLQSFRKGWRHRPALTLSDGRARGQMGENGLDELDRGLVASRHLLTIKRTEVDGMPAVMSNMRAMNTASYFEYTDLVTGGSCRKNNLQQERLDSCGPSGT